MLAKHLLTISTLLPFMAISSAVHADHNYQHRPNQPAGYGALAQMAAAKEHRHIRKVEYAPEREFRNRNAYAAPAYVAVQPDWSRYNGGMSAPAGR